MRRSLPRFVALIILIVIPAVLRADIVVPVDAGTASVLFPMAIDVSSGDQYHAHVDGDLASYTSDADIRYYDFFSGQHGTIPHVPGFPDWLSDVSHGNIAFTRTGSDGGWDVYVYNPTTSALTPVALSPSSDRIFPSIGNNTVAFIDTGTWLSQELPQVLVADLSNPGTAIRLSDAALWADFNSSAGVSPLGNVIVWDSCDTTAQNWPSTCEIYSAVKTGASWNVRRVTTNTDWDAYPRTDGTVITWVSTRAGEQDVYWQDVAGGEEHRLQIPGEQRFWPTVAGGVIAFESVAVGQTSADLYVYQIASNRLFRITSTPDDEQLSDIAALPDGSYRLVWNSGDPDLQYNRNVYGATIELPAVSGGNYSFGGFLQPVDPVPTVNVMKAGAAVPVKFSLGGYRGLNIFVAGYPKSNVMPCSSTALTAGIDETVAAGGSSLQYDPTMDVYTYIWKTDKAWAGTCRQLVINFADSSTQYANFKFK